MPNEDEELPGYHAAADRPSCSNAWYTVESADKLMKFHENTFDTIPDTGARGPIIRSTVFVELFILVWHCVNGLQILASGV